ncbi:Zn-dependent exopeptidase [Pyrrhoderma noxium]|uniref:Inactive metallocarboxypeptidase ECM14 n=1 Tax=Pyrrhoderma noxium TaxID=2282107 RepID=A0A286UEZ8_9AGAM|nr:Zn-dependent exopeptidase [Pyrrhoderma noxium]
MYTKVATKTVLACLFLLLWFSSSYTVLAKHVQYTSDEQAVFADLENLNYEVPDFESGQSLTNKRLGVIHPIPPNRGTGNDSWDLSYFENTTFHNDYHPLYEVDEFLEHIAALFPERVTLFELGHSAEGREMYAVRISSNADAVVRGGERRTGFVISGAQHAREWISTSSALYLIHLLASVPSSSTSILGGLLEQFDFHIIPVPNPDGYVYTWENDRLWYKTRMPLGPGESCQGLDMNRNWGFHWSPSEYPELTLNGEISHNSPELEDLLLLSTIQPDDFTILKKKKKKSKNGKKPKVPAPKPADPCSHWYPGHRPFEAPEVNNIANYIQQTPGLNAFLDLRSYGQMLSYPYSYSCDFISPDAEDQFEAALGMAHSITKKHGSVYTVGSLCSMLYPAPGNIVDWMYGTAGIKFSYAIHLRDLGTYGYALPPEEIIPVGKETASMVEYLAEFMLR